MSNLQHSFTVDAVNKTVDVDTSINVIKRRFSINFQSNLSSEAVGVSYIFTKGISPSNSLSIADRSTSLLANRVYNTGYTTINSNSFTINTDDFLVTDIFTDVTNTVGVLPLFYQHIISIDNLPRATSGAVDTGYTLQLVEILDQSLSPFSLQEKKIDYTNGVIYLNLLPEYNSSSDYSVYYIRYRVITSTGAVETYIDLLDIEPVYQLASFDDLDDNLDIINDGRKVYLVDEDNNNFTIVLPAISSYAFQPVGTGRIRVLPPSTSSSIDPWFVRVSNSFIYTSVGGTRYKYNIGEFLTQSFSPSPPYKYIVNETSTILTKTLVKLSHSYIHQDSTINLYISILVNKANGDGLYALTTDPSLVNTLASNGALYKKWDSINQIGIKSINHYTGIIEIDGFELESTHIVKSEYYFKEDNYEYSLINFNPLTNQNILQGHITIFVDPNLISEDKDQTLYYLQTDNSGKVIESNYPSFDNDTKKWDGKTMYYENGPPYFTVVGNSYWWDGVYYTSFGVYRYFVPEYSVEGDGNFLILADISVAPALSIGGVTSVDTRIRGGGIKENELSNAASSKSEATWVWDEGYWDGYPYPGNASYYVEVPVGILDGAGGTLTQNKVKEIVTRHTAAGVYPITKGYGVDVFINNVQPTASGVLVTWESNGY